MAATVLAPIMSDAAVDVSWVSVCLEILENWELSASICPLLRLDQRQVVERLCKLLGFLPRCQSCDNELRLLEIVSSVVGEASDCWNEAVQELLVLVRVLINDGKVLSAVALAVWLLERFVAARAYMNDSIYRVGHKKPSPILFCYGPLCTFLCTVYFLDQELISYRYSSSCCCCRGDSLQKSPRLLF